MKLSDKWLWGRGEAHVMDEDC